jgi:hypothetical protein
MSRCGAISGTNSQFFRTAKNAKTASVVEQNRVWLNLFNNEGAFKQALVGYVTGATNNFDNGYDGETYDANEFVDFTVLIKRKIWLFKVEHCLLMKMTKCS